MSKRDKDPPWLLEMFVRKRWLTVYRFDDEAVATEQLFLRRNALRSVEWRLIHEDEKAKKMEKANVGPRP